MAPFFRDMDKTTLVMFFKFQTSRAFVASRNFRNVVPRQFVVNLQRSDVACELTISNI
jgi:hypothetical protein